MSRSWLKANRNSGGTRRLHLQGRRIGQERNQHDTGDKCSSMLRLAVLLGLFIYFEDNSVALVRERTIPTERPHIVGEVSGNSCG
jgi:hypothetical protein